jgi:hypothetical protein
MSKLFHRKKPFTFPWKKNFKEFSSSSKRAKKSITEDVTSDEEDDLFVAGCERR